MNTDNLILQLAAPENLLAAWRAVRGNIPQYRRARSAGPDGVTLAEFERDLSTQLNILHDMLLDGRYTPSPPARFSAPKPGGGQRHLAVLSVRDRVAQRAAQQVIEPLWEPDFLECSFGFRPGRSLDQAIACVHDWRASGYRWTVDGDIADCFGSLDHELLVARLKDKIGDGQVLRLAQAWLDVGMMQAGLPHDEPAGPLHSVSSLFQRGLDWALDVVDSDPYAAARYETIETTPLAPGSEALAAGMRRSAVKRLVANGALLAIGWVRPAIAALGTAAKTTLGTPAGRRLLKKGALASGGLAGVALTAALATYLLNRAAGPAPAGVLQGSPLSPLLANIYLHPFDLAMARRGYRLARFADDWVICCPTQAEAEAAYHDAIQALAQLRLKVNLAKTRVLAPGEKLEWLGGVLR